MIIDGTHWDSNQNVRPPPSLSLWVCLHRDAHICKIVLPVCIHKLISIKSNEIGISNEMRKEEAEKNTTI